MAERFLGKNDLPRSAAFHASAPSNIDSCRRVAMVDKTLYTGADLRVARFLLDSRRYLAMIAHRR